MGHCRARTLLTFAYQERTGTFFFPFDIEMTGGERKNDVGVFCVKDVAHQ